MAAAAQDSGQRGRTPPPPISLDGRGPNEGIWSILAVVMIVVAVLFVIGIVSGTLADVVPDSSDGSRSPPPAEPAR